MSTSDQIEARVTIIEVLSHGGYRAELSNGHICIARRSSKEKDLAPFTIGDSVLLAFHPADLSRARILGT